MMQDSGRDGSNGQLGDDQVDLRVLLINEPRAYREVLTLALRRLRPRIHFRGAEADQADAVIQAFLPHLVVLSDARFIRDGVSWSWILLYPDGAQLTVVHTPFETSRHTTFEIDDVLRILDTLTNQ